MNKVEFLKQVCTTVPCTIEVGIGATGYIDGKLTPPASVSKGVDAHGRHFLVLCVRSRRFDESDRLGVVTVFQRYAQDSDVVVQAQNVGYARLFNGAASKEQLESLAELVKSGRAVFKAETFGGKVVETFVEIVSPELGLSQPRLRVA